MKTGLIIQGPLISRGRTGKTARISFHDIKESDVVNYNCVSDIIATFDRHREVFGHMVCVTWDTEAPDVIKMLSENLQEGELVLISDKTAPIEKKGSIISGNNKNRQFFSVKEGIKVLKEKGCDAVIKGRTDQLLEYEALKVKLEQGLEEGESKLYIPWFNVTSEKSVNAIPDFYIGGSLVDMEHFCNEMLNEEPMFESVHYDIFYKWCLSRSKFKPLLIRYFSRVGVKGNWLFTFLFVERKLKREFSAFPTFVLTDLKWRGERFVSNDVYIDSFQFTRIPRLNAIDSLLLVIKTVSRKATKFLTRTDDV
ncbi:hypothetical protein BZG05_15750 [Salinivibrio kushneri]|uniref:hypothetical protein n=1 Tax=Salinivibrio kushneri TaxID=1908198 RepID=UPI000988B26A|nr:hypothetical protein [Salinivibrio kushneri]OOE32071.1 hypothetical protein BZG05_15750 [Salinivibrio kushneri]